MRTITLEIQDEQSWQTLQSMLKELKVRVIDKKETPKTQPTSIQSLLKNPLQVSDFEPFKRNEIYE